MILRQKAHNQFYYWYWNSNMTAVVTPKSWLSSFDGHQQTNKKGTQHHHKLILHSSCHIQRVLVVATKVERGKIRVGNKQLLTIAGDPIGRTFTQRAIRFHHQWYMFLFHWIIHSSTHLSCPRLVNSHPALHITLLMITSALIARTVTQRAIIFLHWWYLCFLHWMIH